MTTSFHETLRDLLAQGVVFATATVIRTAGSTPREVGARMFICRDGRTFGTIGGGCGEAEVQRAALDVLAGGAPVVMRVDLTDAVSLDAGGICGGVMDVLVEPWPAAGDETLLERLVAAAAENRGVALVRSLPPASPLRALVYGDGEAWGALPPEVIEAAQCLLAQRQSAVVQSVDGAVWFVEVQHAQPTLLIAGGGHIAVPLAQMAALLDFRVVVLDDRPGFANSQRFPTAARCICDLFGSALRRFPIDRDTYIVIITRGHQHDVECLEAVLDSPAAYIGMIGSRRRVSGVFDLLERERGVSREKLARVYSPIGLPIGAKTPAEIAVAILAEVVNVYRGGRAASLSAERRRAVEA